MPEAGTIFHAIETMDVDAVAALVAPDARFVFANQEPLVGADAIRAGNVAFFATFQRIRHHMVREWTVGAVTIAETDVTYTRLDGKDVTVPAVTIWDVDAADLITDYRVYIDITPVYAP